MSVEQQVCPKCAAPLPSDSPRGLCRECLLRSDVDSADTTASLVVSNVVEPAQFRAHVLPLVGENLGSYRLTRLLGQGGMGAVYEAEHRETGRRVAVKLMNQALASDTDRKRFLREGRLAASVSHPNVVYVFGSEEIGGSPMIVMELVAAGTLEQRVKRAGPLPVTEAVETLLQIIDGLEAAQAVGVLHRDLKPANCFVGADGTVKVGDFGLSISTLARGESLLTARGSMMGTPGYASPEQLRGDDLDVRTDIYAAGGTLYYLLTGKTPFAADDLVKLIALVLDKPPPSPKSLRPDLPPALAKVVLRCLAKDRAVRYASYDKLRQALQPFRSTALTPGTLLARFGAGTADGVILGICLYGVGATIGHKSMGDPLLGIYQGKWLEALMILFLPILYFACCEGFWGATPGKRLCRLRVTDASGKGIGFRSALLRSACYHSPTLIAPLLLIGLTSQASYLAGGQLIAGYGIYYGIYLLFLTTMRKANGFAMLHDLLSSTRVMSANPEKRMGLRVEPTGEPVSVVGQAGRVGPYVVLETLWQHGGEALFLGYDEILRRKVWIHHVPSGTPPVPPSRWELARAGRLRWLLGRRTETECWDVYEAFNGQPLLKQTAQPQPWGEVRRWLHDLAEEYNAVLKNGSPPPSIGLDRVWVTAGHRALVLDFPCPGVEAPLSPSPLDPPSFEAMQRFLNEVAGRALGSVSLAMDTAQNSGDGTARPAAKAARFPLALHAETFLRSLRERKFESPEILVGCLRSDMARRPSFQWWQPLLSLWTLLNILVVLGLPLMALVKASPGNTLKDAGVFTIGFSFALALFFHVVNLLWSLGVGRPLLLSALDVVVVTREGRPASRLRLFIRALFTALPLWSGVGIMVWLGKPVEWMLLFGLFAALFLPGVIASLCKPHRSLPDRIAGTFLVPR